MKPILSGTAFDGAPKADPGDPLAGYVAQKLEWVAANRERLISAWIAETGALPSQCELVEERHFNEATYTYTVTTRVRRREERGGDDSGG